MHLDGATLAHTGYGGYSVMELNFSCTTAEMVVGVQAAMDTRMWVLDAIVSVQALLYTFL